MRFTAPVCRFRFSYSIGGPVFEISTDSLLGIRMKDPFGRQMIIQVLFVKLRSNTVPDRHSPTALRTAAASGIDKHDRAEIRSTFLY